MIPSTEWTEEALCREVGTEIFFAGPAERQMRAEAKKVCAQCPVINQCLEYGMREEFGIFGGLEPEERRRILRPGNRAARPSSCSRGHEFSPLNTRVTQTGKRICLTCERMWQPKAS